MILLFLPGLLQLPTPLAHLPTVYKFHSDLSSYLGLLQENHPHLFQIDSLKCTLILFFQCFHWVPCAVRSGKQVGQSPVITSAHLRIRITQELRFPTLPQKYCPNLVKSMKILFIFSGSHFLPFKYEVTLQLLLKIYVVSRLSTLPPSIILEDANSS